MKNSPFVVAALTLIAGTTLAAAPAAVRQPTYPLMGIVQVDPNAKGDLAAPPESQIAAAIQTTQLLYSSGPALNYVRDTKNRLHLNTPVILYMGGLTTNGDDILALESKFRRGIGMIDITTLSAPIDARTRELTLALPKKGKLPVVASTAEKSAVRDTSRYCFWLRLDDELVRVTAVDAATGRIQVERGFDRSTPAAHAAGTVVLSPVYVGTNTQLGAARHSNSWPGGPDALRYMLDPGRPEAAAFKATLVARTMKDGYDGAWFDTFQPNPYNICDALGDKVTYFWSFDAHARYTVDTYREAIATYLRGIRADTRQLTGREPALSANSATGSYATAGTKALFNHGATHDLLDGYCFEDSFLHIDAKRSSKSGNKGISASFAPLKTAFWLRNIKNHGDAARSGLHAYCMIGPAGYLAAYFNPALPDYDRLLRFGYASFLLTVTPEHTTSFGLPLLFTRDAAGQPAIQPWPELVYTPIGDPAGPGDLESLRVPGTKAFARAFTHGFVAVNPENDGEPISIPVPAGCVDALTKAPVTSLALAPGDAAVLLRAAE